MCTEQHAQLGNGKRPIWRRALPWVQRSFLVGAVVFIVSYLVVHRDAVESVYHGAKTVRLMGVAVGLVLLHPLTACGLWCVQRFLDFDLGYGRILFSYVNRLPARFIPGGIWHSVARYADFREDTFATSGKLARLFFAELVAVATGACIASGILGLIVFDTDTPALMLALLLLAGGLVGCMGPILIMPKSYRWSRLPRWLGAVSFFSLAWACVGVAFAFVAGAFGGPFAACSQPILSTTYTTAASVGNLAVFAPQGWGVTEMVFALLRPCPIPLPTLLSVIFAFRLVTMVADMFTWIIGRAWASMTS